MFSVEQQVVDEDEDNIVIEEIVVMENLPAAPASPEPSPAVVLPQSPRQPDGNDNENSRGEPEKNPAPRSNNDSGISEGGPESASPSISSPPSATSTPAVDNTSCSTSNGPKKQDTRKRTRDQARGAGPSPTDKPMAKKPAKTGKKRAARRKPAASKEEKKLSLKERLEAAEKEIDEYYKNNPDSDSEILDPAVLFQLENFSSDDE